MLFRSCLPPARPESELNSVFLVIDASSAALRRRVGTNAWVVLEELLLGAALDESTSGQAVVLATVRALATRTGLSKDTVSRSLHKLRSANIVAIEALHDDTGRFISVRYVIGLSALPIVVRETEPEATSPRTPRIRNSTAPQQLSMLA